MDQKRSSNNGFHFGKNAPLSYSNLFNLEPLMNFQLPQQDGDFDNYASSSQDESRGQGEMASHGNGLAGERSSELGLTKRKKRLPVEADAGSNSSARRNSDDSIDEDDTDYSTHISEEHYRSMLGEHVQKYRRVRFTESANLASGRMGTSVTKRNPSSKNRKSGNEPLILAKEKMLHGMETYPDFDSDNYETDYASDYIPDRFSVLDSAYLDIGEGITYRIPPTYDQLVMSLKLPSFSDVRIEEYFLKGTLDLGALTAMMATDRRFGPHSRGGMGDPQPTYESLQARLKALSACNSVQKFSLQVYDIGLDSSSIPEGAAGGIQRSIMSEAGALQVYYVKVLEKGDTYEIIERKLPKKQIVKKDPSLIEKDDMEKVAKVWANIVRRDLPKHVRVFGSFHKKQLIDAKKFSESCQREVKLKVTRSLKLMKGAAIRTRKLTRDMMVFWKRVDKEQAELRKKEEKDAAEALKREQELREAKRQQQRLNFLISQTELYSHFMQNKSNSQAADALASADEEAAVPEDIPSSLANFEPIKEEDPEEAALKKEALRSAQLAVSQQKKLTSTFDSECLKLRDAAEPESLSADTSIAGSSNIDLLNPSTMPLTSSVQTPELFKGCLKGYQLKGLQWLSNCF